jgi:hypothetical protein
MLNVIAIARGELRMAQHVTSARARITGVAVATREGHTKQT